MWRLRTLLVAVLIPVMFVLSTSSAALGSDRPSVRIGSHPAALAHTSTARFRFSSSYANAKYACSLDRRAYTTCRSPKMYLHLGPGPHSFAVKAQVGGIFGGPTRYGWTVAASMPRAQIVSHPSSQSGSLHASFSFSTQPSSAGSECSLDGGPYGVCSSPSFYGPLAKGSHTFAVRASSGRVTGDPAKFSWTIATSGGDVGGVPSAIASATTVSEVEQTLNLFFGQYQMTVAITNVQPSGYARAFSKWTPVGPADLSALKDYGLALLDEWAKYPLDYVAVTRVRGIALVAQLSVSGTRRAAAPDIEGEVMYYDIGYGSTDYAREAIHHEFDHLLTNNLSDSYSPSDPAWLSLNPPGFSYGSGGSSCYVPGNNCASGPHAIPGFVSGYAGSAIEEDKAETYAYLMETNYYWLLQGWIATDSYLAAKVAYYKQFLCALSASMCGGYFDAIHSR